ncbi:MAG: hypothetical protein C0501_15910 [Isosphaera sp.]|nr:hypothetical protein [Isosphaera sp.]
MTPFECQGYWWVPGQEDAECPGTLRCDDSGELRLSLLGALGPTVPALGLDHDLPLVFGTIVRPGGVNSAVPSGELVTLRDCFETKYSFGSTGKATQELFAHRALFGGRLVAAGEDAFTSVTIGYSGLGAWADDLTSLRDGPTRFSLSWDNPSSPTRVPFRGGELTLGVGCTISRSTRERRLTETVGVSVRLAGPTPEADIERDLVSPIQNFLTFATDHPNALTKLQFVPGVEAAGTQPITVVGPQTFDDEEAAEGLLRPRMIFTLSDARPRLQEVLRRWADLSKSHPAAIDMYFALQYRPPGYSDLRLQLLVQVLALYHARAAPPPAPGTGGVAVPGLPDGVRALLESHPLVSGERALLDLGRRHWEVFGPLVRGDGAEGPERFAQVVTDILRYTLTRREGESGQPSGTDYYWRGEQVAFLWKICLLHELGFSTSDQRALLDRNAKYRHLRDQVRPGLSTFK